MNNEVTNTITTNEKYNVAVTQREIDMVLMASKGYAREIMAEKYKLSLRTVETIFSTLNKRFNAVSPAHLVAIFLRDKIIE